MKENIAVSAKEIGQLALPDFCPRCFWIKLKTEKKLPYQIFPGIFSSIDSYSKRLVHGWFDRYHKPPVWLGELGNLVDYVEPPHHSSFFVTDKESGVCLKGTPDAIFVFSDKSYIIADYKTSKFTETQDQLLPMYEVQLNAYAYIGQTQGIAPVSKLALVYTEPVTDSAAASYDGHQYDNGFLLKFSAHIKEIPLRISNIPVLLAKVQEIWNSKDSPPSRDGCKDCERLDNLVRVALNNKRG